MGEVHSLEQLPLNIIFQILTYLSIKDLRNVSQTCKVLRVLCNESITYNKYMKDAQSGRNPWARKLIHNLLAVYNSNDDLMAALSSRGKGASETLRYVYSCMNVGYAGLMHMLGYEGGSLRLEGRPEKLGRYQDLFYDGLPAGDNVHEDVSNLNEQDIEEIPVIEPGDQIDSAQYRNCGQDDGMATDLPRLVFNTNKGQFLKEVCKYQYLNAVRCSSFNHDSAHLYRATSSFENSKEYKWSEFSASRANSPKDALRSSELPMHRRCHTTCTPDSDTDTLSPDSLHFSVSPHSSIGRDSGSSIFSEIPKLSDSCNIQNWSLSYELDPVSDSSDLQHPNTERFLKQLKNPMKVKDKAVLFEMLMAQDVETHKIKKLTYDSFEESKRNIAHSYLEEVQRCNRSIEANFTKGSVDVLVHEQPAPNDMFTKPEVMTKSAVTNPTSSRTSTVRHRRRQLKAVVTDDNRICYERL